MNDAERVRRAQLADMADAPVSFLASFPPIQSAIKVGQDGARVQFDIPETEMPSIVRLMLMRGVVLKITVARGPQPKQPKPTEPEWGDDGDTDSDTG